MKNSVVAASEYFSEKSATFKSLLGESINFLLSAACIVALRKSVLWVVPFGGAWSLELSQPLGSPSLFSMLRAVFSVTGRLGFGPAICTRKLAFSYPSFRASAAGPPCSAISSRSLSRRCIRSHSRFANNPTMPRAYAQLEICTSGSEHLVTKALVQREPSEGKKAPNPSFQRTASGGR